MQKVTALGTDQDGPGEKIISTAGAHGNVPPTAPGQGRRPKVFGNAAVSAGSRHILSRVMRGTENIKNIGRLREKKPRNAGQPKKN